MKIRDLMRSGMIAVCLAGFVMAYTLSIAVSAEKKGNQAKGRYYFRQTCKTCHVKGAAGGEVTPMSKTMTQWRTFFTAARFSKGMEPQIKGMPEEQIRDVHAYLVAHAVDSLQPETCGK